jgi:hypothetical protein
MYECRVALASHSRPQGWQRYAVWRMRWLPQPREAVHCEHAFFVMDFVSVTEILRAYASNKNGYQSCGCTSKLLVLAFVCERSSSGFYCQREIKRGGSFARELLCVPRTSSTHRSSASAISHQHILWVLAGPVLLLAYRLSRTRTQALQHCRYLVAAAQEPVLVLMRGIGEACVFE